MRQILKTNEALKNDGIVKVDEDENDRTKILLSNIDQASVTLAEVLRPLKATRSVFITKNGFKLQNEKLNRNNNNRKRETVDKIFCNFKAISGGQLLQADDEARLRKL